MAMASGSEPGWELGSQDQVIRSLVVELRQRSYVLPWSLFLFAEGTDTEIRATFHTHVLLLQGTGLSAFLEEWAAQSIARLREPDRTAKFASGRGVPQLTSLAVSENK